jgi:hypothetical protein
MGRCGAEPSEEWSLKLAPDALAALCCSSAWNSDLRSMGRSIFFYPAFAQWLLDEVSSSTKSAPRVASRPRGPSRPLEEVGPSPWPPFGDEVSSSTKSAPTQWPPFGPRRRGALDEVGCAKKWIC